MEYYQVKLAVTLVVKELKSTLGLKQIDVLLGEILDTRLKESCQAVPCLALSSIHTIFLSADLVC